MKYLRVAAPAAAAAWFALRGGIVSFPAEPAVYDLLVDAPGEISTVQVKTTTFSTKDGWAVNVGRHPDTHAKKAGRVQVLLRTYKKYIVGNAAGLLGVSGNPVRPTVVLPAEVVTARVGLTGKDAAGVRSLPRSWSTVPAWLTLRRGLAR